MTFNEYIPSVTIVRRSIVRHPLALFVDAFPNKQLLDVEPIAKQSGMAVAQCCIHTIQRQSTNELRRPARCGAGESGRPLSSPAARSPFLAAERFL